MYHLPVKRLNNLTHILGFLVFWPGSLSASFDHSLYEAVLRTHVSQGLVDYKELKEDLRLDQYLEQLKAADLSDLEGRQDKVAFWINAYNAYTLKLITHYYPVSSITDIREAGYESPWKIPWAHIAGKTYTLDQIENAILRPKWPDPRIHYALVCAAQSCPQLRNEAYTAELLDDQFNEQADWFMRNRNDFDLKKREARLSKIYEWYAIDFGDNHTQTLQTLVPHAEEKVAESLKTEAQEWKVSFIEWDWTLNEQ